MTKPTDNELFEQFLDSKEFVNAGSSNGWKGVAKAAWQAAQQQSAGEIAELEAERNAAWLELRLIREVIKANCEESTYDEVVKLKADNERLQAQVNELKSLLNEARDDVAAQLDNYQQLLPYKQHRYDAQKITLDSIDEALTKTAPQCLIEHDNEE